MPGHIGKIALVTGANKGIGFEVASELAKAGCTVLLGARDLDKGREAAGKLKAAGFDAHAIAIDLLDRASITRAAETIGERFGHLDILVNNAGIAVAQDGLPSAVNLDTLEKALQTNFIGTVAVTQAMLPLVRKAPSARIVNVSSGLGSLTLHGDPAWPYASVKYLAYCASKAALNMMTVQLAYELRETGIKVSSDDPGYTATDLNGNSGHQTVAEGAANAVRLALLPDDAPSGSFSNSAGPVPW